MPQPLDRHCIIDASDPVQMRSSNQISPDPSPNAAATVYEAPVLQQQIKKNKLRYASLNKNDWMLHIMN